MEESDLLLRIKRLEKEITDLNFHLKTHHHKFSEYKQEVKEPLLLVRK